VDQSTARRTDRAFVYGIGDLKEFGIISVVPSLISEHTKCRFYEFP
jgi:hypothetical protein